jgi:hypothetical protein
MDHATVRLAELAVAQALAEGQAEAGQARPQPPATDGPGP